MHPLLLVTLFFISAKNVPSFQPLVVLNTILLNAISNPESSAQSDVAVLACKDVVFILNFLQLPMLNNERQTTSLQL